jgi:hypothetical protein
MRIFLNEFSRKCQFPKTFHKNISQKYAQDSSKNVQQNEKMRWFCKSVIIFAKMFAKGERFR